uniref:hypothetical protein n=1 Tax=Streptomyces sp. 44030 TaxID=364102 RepID=UPI0015662D18|nr:hypothetical protein [Streptomyces sp. 44030]
MLPEVAAPAAVPGGVPVPSSSTLVTEGGKSYLEFATTQASDGQVVVVRFAAASLGDIDIHTRVSIGRRVIYGLMLLILATLFGGAGYMYSDQDPVIVWIAGAAAAALAITAARAFGTWMGQR